MICWIEVAWGSSRRQRLVCRLGYAQSIGFELAARKYRPEVPLACLTTRHDWRELLPIP